jgi:hypothetical protein
MIRLYGFSKLMNFYAICYGKKTMFFCLIWAKKCHWFKWYFGHTTSEEVVFNSVNTSGWWFFGFMLTNKHYIKLEERI